MTRIPSYFLNGNLNVVSIELPESVEEIGNRAFLSCEKLYQIFLGSRVKSIGGYALAHCYDLQSIVCKAPTPPECFDGNVFFNTGFSHGEVPNVLYIPIGTSAAYENAAGWSTLKGKFLFQEDDMTSAE